MSSLKKRRWASLSFFSKRSKKSLDRKKESPTKSNPFMKRPSIPKILVDVNENEVNEKFKKLLEDMNIPDDKKAVLIDESLEKKCRMLDNSVYEQNRPTSYYIKSLHRILNENQSDDHISKLLNEVRIIFSSCPISWIKDFNSEQNDGLNLLLKILHRVTDSSSWAFVGLKCLHTFSNCGYGFRKLAKNEDAFLFIAKCLRPDYPTLMYMAVEMLTIHTFYNNHTHNRVLTALYKADQLNNGGNRFIPLIKGVEATNITNEKESLSLACIRFINVIVSPEFLDRDSAPVDEYYRLHLKREFVNGGLLQVYDRLLKEPTLQLTHEHINRFLQEFETDEDDVNDKSETLIRSFDDVHDLYRILYRSLNNTRCEMYLKSILSSLILIRDDPLRNQLFRLIEQVVAEIVLQDESGFCPDPTLKKFDEINLKNLLVDDQLEDLQKKLHAEQLKKDEILMMLELSKNKDMTATDTVTHPPSPSNPLPPLSPPPPPPPAAPPPPPAPSNPNIRPIVKKSSSILKKFGLSRKIFEPQNPMKKANWIKIDDKNIKKKSIWLTIDDGLIPDKIYAELETNFSTKTGQDKVDSIKLETVTKNLKVLDIKSAQNISILLGSYRMDYEKLKRAILEIDTGILTQLMIEQLIKNLPEPEQFQKISELKDVYEELSESEQFCFQLSSIKKLKARLESILFQLKFEDKINEIKSQYHEAEMALTEILKSDGLKKILEIVLSLGNYMNAGSRNQQSIGFELSFLCKLSSTKDKSNTRTLLHFLADVINTNFFHPNDLAKELSHIDKANHLALDATNSNLSEVKKGLKILENQLKSFNPVNKQDKFFDVMEPFSKIVQEQIILATRFQSKMNETYEIVAEYFSFNSSAYIMVDFLSDIYKFKTEFLDAHRTNEEIRIQEERALKSKMEKERRTLERMSIHPVHEATSDEARGVNDNLLMVLKSGDGLITGKRQKVKSKNPDKRNRARTRVLFNENQTNNLVQVTS